MWDFWKKNSELWDLSIFPGSELWDLFFWNISRFGIVRLIFRSYGTSGKIRNCGTYFRFGIVRLIFRKYGILPTLVHNFFLSSWRSCQHYIVYTAKARPPTTYKLVDPPMESSFHPLHAWYTQCTRNKHPIFNVDIEHKYCRWVRSIGIIFTSATNFKCDDIAE
jgi:hypothetical protein